MIRLILLLIVFVCSGCVTVSPNHRTLYGHGRVEFFEDGSVKSIQSESPKLFDINLKPD